MTTNIAKLKSAKGAPPPADDAPDVIADDTRPEKVELRPLQVRIPRTVFEEFSERAGREFGFSHGAKKQLFLKMWETYKAQNM
ncbi:hypothetical protein [Rhodovulum sulfidophilum]|uniref:Uncharacterized protein n=1 Tax=Rhodovulum sulfidophilum TaxID=35806 RepID=A0ABS1RYK2_RHOSU|nr:hypothetical protein [Rhodovulum sulfidophilum]MBL3611177.1 hypothetical protein [Rhodovulum sulfidophilum]MCE8455734.1 hypothetical protein [Rhodovulum sulfidophilum]